MLIKFLNCFEIIGNGVMLVTSKWSFTMFSIFTQGAKGFFLWRPEFRGYAEGMN